uniref:Flagellin n=1 Tax=Schlesneria paludicola TaxID=360056 RepID=A0A7C2K0Q4_9PLAN
MRTHTFTLSRVPNSLSMLRTVQAVSRSQTRLNRVQTQLATGQRFVLPSESPTAATQSIALQKLDERALAFQGSLQTNLGYLAVADQSLATISDALNQARGLLQAGLGDQVTDEERQALALEVGALTRTIIQAANTTYNGRALFAGSESTAAPFEAVAGGFIRYNGNAQSLSGLADFATLVDSGVDGVSGLQAVSSPVSSDLNPVLSLDTRLDQLHRGLGTELGSLRVILDDGVNDVRRTIDLTGAETLQDVKLRIEQAFAADPITVTVDIDPGTQSGLRLTPSAGTVEVRDLESSNTAQQLGIRSGPAAVLTGSDLDPALSLFTPVAALNGGLGIGATAGTGLRIENGGQVSIVDLDGAVTVQDVLNRIREADPNVIADISADGRGIVVSTRLSGADFSIGENGGTDAAGLGLRTFTASTRLDDLNLGTGVPRDDPSPLTILRRDGSTATVDLSQAMTVQDVLDAINAVDPGNLVAGLNAVGNGISLQDNSGVGPLTVVENNWSLDLGLSGTDDNGPAGVLAGRDVNPQQALGGFNALARLEVAIRNRDVASLERLAGELEAAYTHVNVVRGELGNHQRQLEAIDNTLADRHVQIKERLSRFLDVDLAETITEFTAQQQALQAYLQIAAETLQLSILPFL